jgi:glycosyltransferase involved in cell wall biosynthesis
MICFNKRSSSDTPPTIESYGNIPPHPDRIGGGMRACKEFQKKSEGGKPLVSIITVVLNGIKNIEQTIRSVLDQAYDNIEYIIIDGGSTDGTIEIIRKYDDRIAFWVSEPDKGTYDAMNKGIALASGELINLLNSDDFLEPAAVQSVALRYSQHKQPCIIYGHAYAIDDLYSVKARMFSGTKYWLGATINHQTMFVHREIYSTLGLYNSKQYRYAADFDFLVRCFRSNVSFIGIEDCIVNYRNTGISSTSSNHRKEANLISRKYFCFLSGKRTAFVIFNYIWMPFKISLKTFLYKTVGVKTVRKAINIYKGLSDEKN